MKTIIATLSICLISILSFSQRSTADTLKLEGKIMKLPKERFSQNYCITEKECYVLVTDKEEHILNMNQPFTKKLALDNLNKTVKLKGIYIQKITSKDVENSRCFVLNLIPNRSRKK